MTGILVFLLSATAASRPLTAAELARCPQAELRVDPNQAFALKAPGWPAVWVIGGARTNIEDEQQVRVVTPACVLLSHAEAPGYALDGLAFYDLDGDGRVEVTMLTHDAPERSRVRILGPKGPALQRLQDWLNAMERLMTLPELRTLTGLMSKGIRRVTCRSSDLPFAVTDDSRLGAFFGATPVRRLTDGEVPTFVSGRLRSALEGAQGRGCSMTMDPDVPHGSGLVCGEPVDEFNKLLTAVEPPVEFRALGEPVTDVEVNGQRVAIGGLCGLADAKVAAVGRHGKTVSVYTVAADADLRLAACTREEEALAEECYASGGTCVHDVQCVPQPTEWPSSTVIDFTVK